MPYVFNPLSGNFDIVNPVSTNDLPVSVTIKNLTILTSVAANALTIAIKNAAGNDPTAGDPVIVAFRNATSATGTFDEVTLSSALSLTISSGSTLGHANATNEPVYVYLLNNAGTLELAASTTLFDTSGVLSTTAEGGVGGADSRSVIYSATARANVPMRLVGRLTSNQTTAGTWAANMTQISLLPLPDTVSRRINADTSGTAIPQGMVGNIQRSAVTTSIPGSTTLNTATDITTITLKSGTYNIRAQATVAVQVSSGTGSVGVVTQLLLTDNANSTITFRQGNFTNSTIGYNRTDMVLFHELVVSATTTYKLRFSNTQISGTPIITSAEVVGAAARPTFIEAEIKG